MSEKIYRILVVDDSLVFCRFLSEAIPKLNSRYQVIGYAMNTRQAMQAIEREKPDVITMDIEMPQENGLDFLKRLLPVHPIPVILISSVNLNVLDALSCGAVDFLRKPDMTRQGGKNSFLQLLNAKLLIASQPPCRHGIFPLRESIP